MGVCVLQAQDLDYKKGTYPETNGSISICVKSFEYVMGVQCSVCKQQKVSF